MQRLWWKTQGAASAEGETKMREEIIKFEWENKGSRRKFNRHKSKGEK